MQNEVLHWSRKGQTWVKLKRISYSFGIRIFRARGEPTSPGMVVYIPSAMDKDDAMRQKRKLDQPRFSTDSGCGVSEPLWVDLRLWHRRGQWPEGGGQRPWLGGQTVKHSLFSSSRWLTQSHLSCLADSGLIWRARWRLPALSSRFSLTFFSRESEQPKRFLLGLGCCFQALWNLHFRPNL